MKKKILRVISLLLAGTTILLTGCQHGENEPINGSTGDGSIIDTTDSGSEDGSEGDEPDEFYFPEYAPDPAPTEKITVSPKRISSGKNSSFRLALDEEGKLWGWGANDYGQVGNGEQTTISYDATAYTPQEAKTEARFVSVSAGAEHTLAIDEEGNLWGWGKFEDPEEGNKNLQGINTPTQLMIGKKYVYAEAGSNCSFAIDTNGRLWAWGSRGGAIEADEAIHFATDKTFLSVYSYGTVAYAIDTNGHLWGWGRQSLGSGIGDGTTETKFTPTAIMPERRFAQVTTNGSQTYALDEDGRLWGWGLNSKGTLGDGTQETQLSPVPIMEGKYFTYVEAVTGERYAIDVQGDLWIWGNKSEVLNAKYYPQKVVSEVKFLQVSEGLALDENGEFWVWGLNAKSQTGGSAMPNILFPTQAFEDMRFSKVINTLGCTYAIDTEANLWVWGNNGVRDLKNSLIQIMPGKKFKVFAGGLAIDTDGKLWRISVSSPQENVQIMPDKKFINVESVGDVFFAIDTQNNLWAWGDSQSCYGCLGLGNVIKQETPTIVKKGVKFVQVEAGWEYVTAIDIYGNFWGWGENRVGQIGSEHNYRIKEPIQFREGMKFLKVALMNDPNTGIDAGNYAIDSEGKLYAWFGYDDIINHSTISSELRLENKTFTSVAVGKNHALAIDNNGKLYIWGYNSHGQLGIGIKGNSTSILNYHEIMIDRKFTFIAARWNASFAIDTEGKLWVWGDNAYGQLNGAQYQISLKKISLN